MAEALILRQTAVLMGFFSKLFGQKNEGDDAPREVGSGSPTGDLEPSVRPVSDSDNRSVNSRATVVADRGDNDWQNAGGVPQELAVMEAVEMHKSAEPPIFLDVRESHELQADGSIPGSVHIPTGEVEARLGELDRERPVIVYCASGMRSMDVGSFLLEKGFRDVSNLNGGYNNWTGPRQMNAE